MAGAWVGSQGSYWLGHTAGATVVERMKVGQGAMARARALFDRHGAGFVVLAQLIWPIATLTQVLSGAWGMRRMGTSGQSRMDWYGQLPEAETALVALLRSKRKRGYRP